MKPLIKIFKAHLSTFPNSVGILRIQFLKLVQLLKWAISREHLNEDVYGIDRAQSGF